MCYIIFTCLYAQSLSPVRLFAIPQTIAHQAPLSVEFSRQEYWSGLPFPTPRDLPDQGSRLCLLHWKADFLQVRQVEAHISLNILIFKITAILPHTWQVILKCLLSLLLHASRLTFKRPESVPLPDNFLCQRLLCPPCHTWGINQLYSLEVHLRRKRRAGGIIISASSLLQGTESEACFIWLPEFPNRIKFQLPIV